MSRQPLHTPEQAQALQKTIWSLHDMNYSKNEIAKKTHLNYGMVRKYLDPYIISKKISIVPRDQLIKYDVLDIDGEQFNVNKAAVQPEKEVNNREEVVRLKENGETVANIAKYLSISTPAVYYHLKKHEADIGAEKTRQGAEIMNQLLTEPAPEAPKSFNLAPTLNYKKAAKPKTRKPWSVKIEDENPKLTKLEAQVKELKKINSKLAKKNVELFEQVYEKDTRGFWARLLNK